MQLQSINTEITSHDHLIFVVEEEIIIRVFQPKPVQPQANPPPSLGETAKAVTAAFIHRAVEEA
jgi:hypothetical protein